MNGGRRILTADDRVKLQRMLNRWRKLYPGPDKTPIVVDSPKNTEEERELLRANELWLVPPRPYPGLRSFMQDEAGVFFARTREKDDLLKRLGESGLLIVLGGSGSGKSSLVKAGLIPELTFKASGPGRSGRWYAVEFRPEEDPNRRLLNGLRDGLLAPAIGLSGHLAAGKAPPNGPSAVAAAFGLKASLSPEEMLLKAEEHIKRKLFPAAKESSDIRNAPLNIAALFDMAARELDRFDAVLSGGLRVGPPNLLILLDQFEEVFRPEIAPRALENLCELAKAVCQKRPPGLFLAITLRSEELHRCAEVGLAKIVTETSYLLGPLDDNAERRKIIVAPAHAVFEDWLDTGTAGADGEDTTFTAAVVKLLLDESRQILNGPGHRSDHLPLLQHALLRIWDAAAERWSRELQADAPMDLHIGMEDLHPWNKDDKSPFLLQCLNHHAREAKEQAIQAAQNCLSEAGDPAARAKRVLDTTLATLARKDERGNWSRRFAGAARVADVLGGGDANRVSGEKSAGAVLEALRVQGYLNAPPRIDELLYDVSHEALIRNWDTYRTLLKEIDEVEDALAEVARNLKKTPPHADPPRGPLAWMKHLWKLFWPWFNEDAEKAALQAVPDRVRDKLGSVLSAEPRFSRRLAAALLVDLEEQQDARQGKIMLSERSAETRAELENDMLSSVDAMEVPWRRASRYARLHISRAVKGFSLIAAGFVFVVVGGVAYYRVQSAHQREEADFAARLAAQKSFEATAAQIAYVALSSTLGLDEGQSLKAVAFQLVKAFQKLKRLEDAARGVPSPDANIDLAERAVEQAARRLTSKVILRSYPTSNLAGHSFKQACAYHPMPEPQGVNTVVPSSTLLRNRGLSNLGLKLDSSRGWIFVSQSSDSSPVPATAPPTLQLSREALVCLSVDAALAIIWPRGQRPQFWSLSWYCQESVKTNCTKWGVDPQYIERPYFADRELNKFFFPKEFDSEEFDRISDTAAHGTSGVPPGSGIFMLQDNQSRAGFVIISKERNFIADVSAGLLVSALSLQAQPACEIGTDGSCKDVIGNEDLWITRHETKYEGPNNDNDSALPKPCVLDAPCIIDIEVFSPVPGTEDPDHPMRVAAMQIEGTPVQQITTDGDNMYLVDKHGVWRRVVIGHKALMENVKEFVQGFEPQNEPRLRISDACVRFDCVHW